MKTDPKAAELPMNGQGSLSLGRHSVMHSVAYALSALVYAVALHSIQVNDAQRGFLKMQPNLRYFRI